MFVAGVEFDKVVKLWPILLVPKAFPLKINLWIFSLQ